MERDILTSKLRTPQEVKEDLERAIAQKNAPSQNLYRSSLRQTDAAWLGENRLKIQINKGPKAR